MNKRFLRCISVIAAFFVCALSARAQEPLRGSGDLIKEGVTAYDTGNYKQAIRLFQQVAEGDTNYNYARYELCLACVADSAYDRALDIARTSLRHPEAEKRSFLLQIANIKDYQGQTDSAIYYYRELIKLNPNDHQPLYETGIVYTRKEQFDTAIYYFQQSLMVNPFHARSHQGLGLCYALQGRLTEAWICLQTAMLHTSAGDVAQKSIRYLDEISRQTDDISNAFNKKEERFSHSVYDDIDAILHARLIRNDQYKIKSVLDNEVQAKGAYAIMEKLSQLKDDNFVMQYYVPLWLEIRDKGLTDAFLLQIYSGYGFEKIDQLHKKNKSDVNKAKDIVYNYTVNILGTRVLDYSARQKAPLRYKLLIEDGIYGAGSLKDPNEFTEGDVTYYKHGTLLVQGHYNSSGKRDGTWKYYYPGGRIKSIEQRKNDQLSGERKEWYVNGQQKSILRYDQDGNTIYEKDFNEYGIAEDEYTKTADKVFRHDFLYASGKKKASVLISEKKYLDGTYENWHENGKVKRHYEVRKELLEGDCKEYYEDGKESAVYHYTHDKLDGAYKGFHENGKPAQVSTYKSGELDGLLEQWNDDGKQTVKQEYRNGKLHGRKYYFDEGINYGWISYENGKPVAYEFRDLNGKATASDKGPLSVLKIYYSNGNLKSETPLKEGLISGTSRFYFYGGPLKEQTEYLKDNREGSGTEYYAGGQKQLETRYKEDRQNGWYRSYYVNGKLYAEGWLENGLKQGIWSFYNVNGTITNRMFYNQNELNGFVEDFNTRGELVSKDYYFEKGIYRMTQYDSSGKEMRTTDFDKGSGTYEFFFPGTQQAYFSCPLVNGQLHGEFRHFYPDGSIREKGYYKYGKRDSIDFEYNIAGVCINQRSYKEGDKHGKWSYFNDAGKLVMDINYKDNELEGERVGYEYDQRDNQSFYRDGNKHGEQIFYGEEQKPGVKLIFSESILMGYTYQDKEGKWLPMIALANGTGDVTAYFANGKQSVALHYEQSHMKGKQLYYYSDGTLKEENHLSNTEYNGELKEYHPNGKIRLASAYLDDELHGAYTEYDMAGNVLSSKNYFHGYLHGVCMVTDPKTKAQKKMLYRYGTPVKTL